MKFLLVEDDKALAGAIEQLLSEHHYIMDLATDGLMGRDMAEAFPYDFILLDWILPKLNGIDLCKYLRNQGNYTPIILMTARDGSSDKVAGLDAGADDYLVKPFEFEELLARIRALLRRAEGLASPILQWGDLCLDPRSSEVSCRNIPIAVTPKEYALLELFLRNPSRIFSLDNLLDKVWAYDDMPNVGSVRTHIKGLRQKLKKAGITDVIATVYGLGYRLNSGTSQPTASQTQEPAAVGIETNLKNNETTGLVNLAALWQPVSQTYIQRVNHVANCLRSLHPGLIDKSVQKEILSEAHALAGSLGSFGFTAVTTQCREIERILSANAYLSAEHISQLEAAISHAQRVLEKGLSDNLEDRAEDDASIAVSSAPGLLPTPVELQPGQLFQLLMVARIGETDPAWIQSLDEAAGRYRMQILTVHTVEQAKAAIFSESAPPHIVVFDFDGSQDLPDSDSDEFKLLAQMQSAQPPIPNLVLTAAASFENRVRVARMGVDSLLQVPVAPTDLLETASRVLRKGVPPTAKLLIVDDDAAMLTLIQSLLQPWGFQLQLLSDSKAFWQTLESFEPDLILLDVRMPKINGFELCQVLRDAPRWHDLPVIFMSGYTDAETIQQVFSSGADDYIRKPIVAPELVARVLGWLERSRTRKLIADVDNLTGVENRRKSTQSLNQLIGLAQRQGQTLCLAVIDLDNFKQINDDYGHPEGDRVLKRFGASLQTTFRDEDVVARWGGEEFVVGLYGVSRQEGVRRLRQLLHAWQTEQFEANPTASAEEGAPATFTVAFSAGVAVYPHDATDLQQLYQAADKALYQAKATGRNRISHS